jgi:hypothetical protein
VTFGYEQIRFLADEDFNAHIVAGLRHRKPELDIVTASDAGILGKPDINVLTYAAEDGRLLVSHDVRTLGRTFDTLLAGGRQSPGLILIAQTLPIREAIEAILLIWEASTPAEWQNTRIFLPL